MSPSVSSTAAHTNAELKLANWNRQYGIANTPAISGTVDFSTPAQVATAELLPALPNGHQVTLAELGHSTDFWSYRPEAGERLLGAFFDHGRIDDSLYAPREVDFEPGYVLVHKGMPGSGMFVIEEGTVVVDLTSRQVELGPGEALGELALLNDSVHTGRARAVTRVKALAIARDEFAQLIDSHPSIARGLLSVLARRLASSS